MSYRKVATFILFMFLFSMFYVSKPVKSLTTVSKSFYAETDDGFIRNHGADYQTVHDADSGNFMSTANYSYIGQFVIATNPYICRSYFYFNTSTLLDEIGGPTKKSQVTFTSATLSLYPFSDASNTDFDIIVQYGGPTYPSTPLTLSDYNHSHYSGNGGEFNTKEFSGARSNITLNPEGIRDWINETGLTKFCLRSSRDINSEVPTGHENVAYYTIEKGLTYAPIFQLTYNYETEESSSSGGDTGDGAKETTLPKITVPKFHIPTWGYYLILGSIAIVAFASILTKPRRTRGSPRGVKVKKNQKRFPKRNKKGRFSK